MRFDSLTDVLVDQLSDLYDAEHQLVAALPKVSRAAQTPELREALDEHLEQTRNHVKRLDEIFGRLDIAPTAERCEAMKGILAEGEEVTMAAGDPWARDAALIAAAQRVEHYEIAGYGTARALADQLGMGDVSSLLASTLDEESDADSRLTKLATGKLFASGINDQAAKRDEAHAAHS
jgi:ferritin-like metal-binding protein YciE